MRGRLVVPPRSLDVPIARHGLFKGVREAEDAPLGDDAGDELGRCHVERGVVDGRLGGRRLTAAGAADFVAVALLDGGGRPRRGRGGGGGGGERTEIE